MKILFTAFIALVSVPAFGADIIIVPGDQEVIINGKSVVCTSTMIPENLDKIPDDVVFGMAKGGKLGSCSATEAEYDGVKTYSIFLKSGTGSTMVQQETSVNAIAYALRHYVKAGACY